MTIQNFRTPEEYIEYYSNILKEDFGFNDLKIEYHGLIGYLINLFGWTQYDILSFYNYLFKEGFISSAEETKNLYIHGLKWGYQPEYARASLASGNLIFDFDLIPNRASNILKREVLIGNNLNQTSISVGGYTFTSNTVYKFVEDRTTDRTVYYCILSSPAERIQIISSSSPKVKVPLRGFYQRELKKIDYITTGYEYGTHHQYTLNLTPDQYVENISAKVKQYRQNNQEIFLMKQIKTFENPVSKVLFLTKLTDRSMLIETGNGFYGMWIPNSNVYLDVWTTKGKMSNYLKNQEGKLTVLNPKIIRYGENNNIISSSEFSSSLVKVEFFSAIGGNDPLTDLELKKDIINWIQSRENLINQTDFYNLFSFLNKDFSVLLKKGNLVDNNFYLYRSLRNQNQNIIKTANYTYPCIRYDDPELFKNIKTSIVYNLSNSLPANRYYYKIVAVDKFYRSIPSQLIPYDLSTSERDIVIQWDPVPNAEYYIVYGRTQNFEQSWIVQEPLFQDSDLSGNSRTLFNSFKVEEQINFPEFQIELDEKLNLLSGSFIWELQDNNIYKISNFDFYFEPTGISYNDISLSGTETKRLDQLIENSWVIIDNKLYLKLDEEFNRGTASVILNYQKTINVISPFIYKYDSFFNWFRGYFIYDDIIQYPIITSSQSDEHIIPYFFNIVYDYDQNKTNIILKSHQSLSDYSFKIKVNTLNYIDLENNIYTIDGFLSDDVEIFLDIYYEGSKVLRSTTPVFKQSYSLEDQLTLLHYYDETGNAHITSIPVIEKEYINISENLNFEDRDYVYSQIFDFFINSNLNLNRMQSDSIQTRFLNTIYSDTSYHNLLLKQEYTNSIILPLQLKIDINYQTANFNYQEEYDKILLSVAQELQEKHTGINIKFYPSQIIDLIHSLNPEIKSVKIHIFDSINNNLNDGLETTDERNFIYKITNKLKLQQYSTTYWYWDLENIQLNLSA